MAIAKANLKRMTEVAPGMLPNNCTLIGGSLSKDEIDASLWDVDQRSSGQ